MWILTSEYNDFEKHGQYFITAFKDKPNYKQLSDILPYASNKTLNKLTIGGGREDDEYYWYNLFEITDGEASNGV